MRQKCVNCKYFIKATSNNIFGVGGLCKADKYEYYLPAGIPTQFNKCLLHEEKQNETNNKN